MAEYEVIEEAEIAEGSCAFVWVEGIEIGIFRSNGHLYAYRNWCPHDGGPVCRGTVTGTLVQGPETEWKLKWEREGEILYCPWHATDFDLATGEAVTRKPLRLKGYPIRVENGKIRITLERGRA
jgi:nitrite reductase/ring-hydroxylating ferredoxin subunit